MFRFKGSCDIVKFDKGAYVQALNEVLADELKNAMRAWLKAVIAKVPVYTGMARGSLIPLARALGETVPISPVAKRMASTRLYGRGVRSTPSEGASRTALKFESRIGHHEVTINIGTIHYMINEFNRVSLPLHHPGPWHSFEAGRKAYKDYLRRNLKKRIPRILKYISKSKVTLG